MIQSFLDGITQKMLSNFSVENQSSQKVRVMLRADQLSISKYKLTGRSLKHRHNQYFITLSHILIKHKNFRTAWRMLRKQRGKKMLCCFERGELGGKGGSSLVFEQTWCLVHGDHFHAVRPWESDNQLRAGHWGYETTDWPGWCAPSHSVHALMSFPVLFHAWINSIVNE